MKRSRRGGRRPQSGQSSHNGSGGGGGGGYNPNRVYDSNGPEVKIRGTASHVYEKYLQLARDANASGDRVMAENYLQHAEHYFRIMSVVQAQFQPPAPQPAPAPGMGAQPRVDAAGTVVEEQPFVEDSSAQNSAPSFSLGETVVDADDEEDDVNEAEEAQA